MVVVTIDNKRYVAKYTVVDRYTALVRKNA